MFYDGEQPPRVDDGNHGDSAGGSTPSTSKSSSNAGSSDVVLTYQLVIYFCNYVPKMLQRCWCAKTKWLQ